MSLKTPSLIGQPSLEAHEPTGTEVVLGFLAVAEIWPGPKGLFSQGHYPDAQMVREAPTRSALPSWRPGVGGAHIRVPKPQGKLRGAGTFAAWPGPEPAEVVREEEMTQDKECNGKSGP